MPDSVEFSASARDPLAPGAVTPEGFPQRAWRYRAFISYSHADTPWANWLLKKLEGYRVPARFHGCAAPVGAVGPRLAPVFRDRDELPTTSDLGETIRAALRESATLIVICSPGSAKSRWVQEEIIAFKRLHGGRRVFAFIVAGEPKVEGTADDCFSPALRRELAPDGTLTGARAEVVAADARSHADGKSTAFVRLVAGLLGVGFDELRRRELQRRNRRLTLITAASVAGMVLTLGLAFAAWRARGEAVVARNEAVFSRNDAQRRQDQAEDVLAFMLGDFRDDLKKVGQLALLVLDSHGALEIGGRGFDVDTRVPGDPSRRAEVGAYVKPGEAFRLRNDGDRAMRVFASVAPTVEAPEFPAAMTGRFDDAHPLRLAPVDPAQRQEMGDRFFQVMVSAPHGSTMLTQFIGEIPRSKAWPHRHLYEESLIVVAGEGMMWTETRRTPVRTGDVIFLPRKQKHSLECTSDVPMFVAGVIYPGDNPSINYYD